ncbi:MAG: hypothetical protein V1873_01340, partial [Verrucomicrobiota bacterium]
VEFEDTTLPADVAEHVNQCSACRQHSRQMESVRRLMSLKKYERPDPGFEERSALAIRRRLEDLNRQPESQPGSFWEFLTDYPRPAFRYALAAVVAALVVINFVSMPRLAPVQPAEPVARVTPPPVPTSTTIPFEVYRQPALAAFQSHSNRGPAHVEYGPRESVPVNYEY